MINSIECSAMTTPMALYTKSKRYGSNDAINKYSVTHPFYTDRLGYMDIWIYSQ